ncbi:MAG: hypothetical protein R2939_16825 [Kofleriaceae bacterium]
MLDATLLLDERIAADGTVARIYLARDGAGVVIRDDAGVLGALPVVAVERVLARYGRELDPAADRPGGDALELGPARLRRLRFHAVVDAEARDYLVWEAAGAPPLAALATTVAAALRHLCLAAGGAR